MPALPLELLELQQAPLQARVKGVILADAILLRPPFPLQCACQEGEVR